MMNTYRATWYALFNRYEWPAEGAPRYDERMIQGWEDLRALMLEHVRTWMREAHVYSVDLMATLEARAGRAWWREEKVEAVQAFLDSL